MENSSALFLEMDKCHEKKWELSLKSRRKTKMEAEEVSFQDPYPKGAWDAYSAVKSSESSKYVLIDSVCWDDCHADFIKTLISFGITSFVIVYDGVGAFNDIYEFVNAGCTLVKAITVIKEARRTGRDKDIPVRGLLFNLPVLGN